MLIILLLLLLVALLWSLLAVPLLALLLSAYASQAEAKETYERCTANIAAVLALAPHLLLPLFPASVGALGPGANTSSALLGMAPAPPRGR